MTKVWSCNLAVLMQPLALLVVHLALRVPVMAQGETTSAITGSVTDPTGAAIRSATVTVTSSENGMKRSVKTDDAGRFTFPQLKPGMYSVKAEVERFEAHELDHVGARLIVGSSSESVVVGMTHASATTLCFAGIREQFVGDSLLDVISLASEDRQRFILRLPAEVMMPSWPLRFSWPEMPNWLLTFKLESIPEGKINDSRLYRCLDRILPHKSKLEQHLKQRYGELFQAQVRRAAG